MRFEVPSALAVTGALLAVLLAAGPVLGNHQVANWRATTRVSTYLCCYLRHEAGDSFRTRTTVTWTSANAANMRTNRANGMYWTIDHRDNINYNVDNYMWGGSLPNPYWDFDDDNGDGRFDEGELVSESSSFPSAGTTYTADLYWSHWWLYLTRYWTYDGDGGTIRFYEALSTRWAVGDRYNTHCCQLEWAGLQEAYPANPQGSVASESVLPSSTESGAISSLAQVGADRPYRVATNGDGDDVTVVADFTDGLDAYATKARHLAREVIAAGPARGVVTFRFPVALRDVKTILGPQVTVAEIEVVTEPAQDGLRWTFGARADTDPSDLVGSAAAASGLAILGVTSATVQVADPLALRRLERSPEIYLVDLSAEDYQRTVAGGFEVGQNDVYWHLAGWDD